MKFHAVRFWSVAIIGFIIIVAETGLAFAIPGWMMGRSLGINANELILAGAALAVSLTINGWFALLARID